MKTAIIGGGPTGLTLAWLLSQQVEVDIYEKKDRLGGLLGSFSHQDQQIERGLTYYFPSYHHQLQTLFDYLNIYTEPRPSSYAYIGSHPYIAKSLLFTQPSFKRLTINRAVKKGMHRFIHKTRLAIDSNSLTNFTLKQYLSGLNLTQPVRETLLPALIGMLWHCVRDQAMDGPAEIVTQFLHQSGLLDTKHRHPIRYMPHGFDHYINKLLFKGKFSYHLNSQIDKIERNKGSIILKGSQINSPTYDQVIVTCRIDKVPSMLHPMSNEEHHVLSNILYSSIGCYLHQDTTIIPQLDKQAAPLFSLQPYDIKHGTNCAYHINLQWLQDGVVPLYLSFQPAEPPAEEKTLLSSQWHQPVHARTVRQAIQQLDQFQGLGGIWYSNMYHDTSYMTSTVGSALALAKRMGITLPFSSSP